MCRVRGGDRRERRDERSRHFRPDVVVVFNTLIHVAAEGVIFFLHAPPRPHRHRCASKPGLLAALPQPQPRLPNRARAASQNSKTAS